MSPAEVEAYLHENIPISLAMGVRVLEAGSGRVVVEAPLAPNLNHRATAFGGSVAALAILAGWTQVHMRLRGEGFDGHTVIHESSVEYTAPVRGDFRALCDPVDDERWTRLKRTIERRGKGRAWVEVVIESEGEEVGRFRGAYVALAVGAAGQ